jgi:hypothetical protein
MTHTVLLRGRGFPEDCTVLCHMGYVYNQVIYTKIYSAEFSGVLVGSNEIVCRLVGTEVSMSVSTLPLPSSLSVVKLEGGILRRNRIESEYLR